MIWPFEFIMCTTYIHNYFETKKNLYLNKMPSIELRHLKSFIRKINFPPACSLVNTGVSRKPLPIRTLFCLTYTSADSLSLIKRKKSCGLTGQLRYSSVLWTTTQSASFVTQTTQIEVALRHSKLFLLTAYTKKKQFHNVIRTRRRWRMYM